MNNKMLFEKLFSLSVHCFEKERKLVIRTRILPRIVVAFVIFLVATSVLLVCFLCGKVFKGGWICVWSALAFVTIVYSIVGIICILFSDGIVCTPDKIILYKGFIPYRRLLHPNRVDCRIDSGAWISGAGGGFHLYTYYALKKRMISIFYPLSETEARALEKRINEYLHENRKISS
jgi:hypothetical protein